MGKDISFEHALVKRYGVTIELLDPSPTALETMTLPENRLPQFRYRELALAGYTRTLNLAPPSDPKEGSLISQIDSSADANQSPGHVTVACSTVGDLMQELGHKTVNLLKIDIEGAEYGFLDAILRDRIPIRQIAVEYHNDVLPGIPRSLTIDSLLLFYRGSYPSSTKVAATTPCILRAISNI